MKERLYSKETVLHLNTKLKECNINLGPNLGNRQIINVSQRNNTQRSNKDAESRRSVI